MATCDLPAGRGPGHAATRWSEAHGLNQGTRRRRRTSGFTLIELLVVVAVIGILAALLMPAILGGMQSAMAAKCKNNLRQIFAGMMNYARQYDMCIVATGYPPKFLHWHNSLQPFVSPGSTRDAAIRSLAAKGNSSPSDSQIYAEVCVLCGVYACPAKPVAPVGYGMNYMVLGSSLSLWGSTRSFASVKNPSGTVIFCDTGWVSSATKNLHPSEWKESTSSISSGYVRFPYSASYTQWDTSPVRPVPRHPTAFTNCLFFDGHSKGIETADLVDELYGEPNCLYDNQ